MEKHEIKTGGLQRVGVSKPIGKEWVEKINKNRTKKSKEK